LKNFTEDHGSNADDSLAAVQDDALLYKSNRLFALRNLSLLQDNTWYKQSAFLPTDPLPSTATDGVVIPNNNSNSKNNQPKKSKQALIQEVKLFSLRASRGVGSLYVRSVREISYISSSSSKPDRTSLGIPAAMGHCPLLP
jgi:hypothetical protein